MIARETLKYAKWRLFLITLGIGVGGILPLRAWPSPKTPPKAPVSKTRTSDVEIGAGHRVRLKRTILREPISDLAFSAQEYATESVTRCRDAAKEAGGDREVFAGGCIKISGEFDLDSWSLLMQAQGMPADYVLADPINKRLSFEAWVPLTSKSFSVRFVAVGPHGEMRDEHVRFDVDPVAEVQAVSSASSSEPLWLWDGSVTYGLTTLDVTDTSNGKKALLQAPAAFRIEAQGSRRLSAAWRARLRLSAMIFAFSQPREVTTLSTTTPALWSANLGAEWKLSERLVFWGEAGYGARLGVGAGTSTVLALSTLSAPEASVGARFELLSAPEGAIGVEGSLGVLLPAHAVSYSAGLATRESARLRLEQRGRSLVWFEALGGELTSFSSDQSSQQELSGLLSVGVRFGGGR